MSRKNFALWFRKARKIFLILFVAQLVYIVLLKWVNPPITDTQLSNWIGGYGLKRDYVCFKDIFPNVWLSAIAFEDQIFSDPNGFYMTSIKPTWVGRRQKNKS